MQLLTIVAGGRLRLAAKTPSGIIDLAAAQAALGAPRQGLRAPESMEELLAGGAEAQDALAALIQRAGALGPDPSWVLDEGKLVYAPCVPRTGKIILVGRNYRRHAAETGHDVTDTPSLFGKFGTSLAGHGEQIPLPRTAIRYDYEAELAVVIGRHARYVSQQDALGYVLGYCCANDLSARDLQFLTSQWLIGKSLDKFMPVGPYVVTADEVGDPQALDVRCWLNGELRQDANTGDMVFTVAALISYVSQYMALRPGDLISTGTPEGVIAGRAEQVWLKPGDEVVVEVEKVGRLSNKLIAEDDI
jgi:2-keto-4-pentenoate hydratase/2-oxohepta-3-ene-1,7-dioic acid hydratase in catechol pathway